MKKYKICLSVSAMDPEFEKLQNELSSVAEIDVVGLSDFSLAGYDIFVGKKLSEDILKTADKLKIIFAYKTGVDEFPLNALGKRNIILVNSHIDADYIAEYAFALSMSLTSSITEYDKKLRRGIWYDAKNPYWKSIFKMKVGLMGYGHIGREIHKLLLRNNIEAYTINRNKKYENIKLVSSFDELCRECDIIIASLPSTDDTDKIFNESSLELLSGKYLVNVGRSNCVDQKALYDSLVRGELAGAAIDTWDEKPKNNREILNPSKYPLTELENIVLSPHRAMFVSDGHARYVEDIKNKIMAYIKGEELWDTVDLSRGY